VPANLYIYFHFICVVVH